MQNYPPPRRRHGPHPRACRDPAADVAGYSRLMGADGEGTLAALKALRAS